MHSLGGTHSPLHTRAHSNMSARRPLPALLLLLLAAVVVSTAKKAYQFSELKGLAGLSMEYVYHLYIPDDQCSGSINFDNMLPECLPPAVVGALQVNVTDYSPYPGVYIADYTFSKVVVTRARPCKNAADVKVAIGCVQYSGSQRAPAPVAPKRRSGSKEPSPLRPMSPL